MINAYIRPIARTSRLALCCVARSPDELQLPGLEEPLQVRADIDQMLSARRSASEGGGWDDRTWEDGSAYASHPEGHTRPHYSHTIRRMMKPGVAYFRDNRTFHR